MNTDQATSLVQDTHRLEEPQNKTLGLGWKGQKDSPFMLKMYNASRLIKILNVQEMSFIVRLVAVAIYKLKVGINRRRECAATAHRWILFGAAADTRAGQSWWRFTRFRCFTVLQRVFHRVLHRVLHLIFVYSLILQDARENWKWWVDDDLFSNILLQLLRYFAFSRLANWITGRKLQTANSHE